MLTTERDRRAFAKVALPVIPQTQQQDLEEHRSRQHVPGSDTLGQPGELTEKLDQLLALLADAKAEHQAVEEEGRRPDPEQPDMLQRVGQRIERLDELITLLAEVDVERDAFRKERRQWEVERAKAERELDARAEGLDACQAELDARLARAEDPSTPPETEQAPDKSEQDESIGEYMARLLERTRELAGGSTQRSESSGISRWKPVRKSTPGAELASTDSTSPAPAPQATETRQGEPVEISPRAAAPETAAIVSAMRELANFSARTAIHRYTRRTLIREIQSKLLVMTVGLVVGAGLMWLSRAYGLGQLLIYTAAAGFVVAVYWGVQSIALADRMTAGKAEPRNDKPK